MLAFLIRFTAAGLLVASLPIVAAHLGPRTAGLLLLFPAVSLGGLVVLGMQGGTTVVAQAALGGLTGLPAVLVFFAAVLVTAQRQLPLGLVLGIGLIAWLITASILVTVAGRAWGES